MPGPSFSVFLEGDRLVSRAVGPFGRERRVEIPIQQIEGFCIDPTGQKPNAMIPWDAYLVVVWREGTTRRHEKAPVLKDAPALGALVSTLEQLRPEASLLKLPPGEAMKQLGIQSARSFNRWIAGVVLTVIALGGLAGFLFPKKAPGNHQCGNLPGTCAEAMKELSNAERAPTVTRELDAACAAGNLDACATLGPFLLEGAGVQKDEQRAVEAVQRACSGGVAQGCNNLAVMYSTGRAVARDDAQGADLYKRACELGDSQGCYNYGGMMQNGWGVEKNETQAAHYLKRACETGESNGCLNLGNLYYNGRGVPKDLEQARTFWDRACRAGNDRGCTNLHLLK